MIGSAAELIHLLEDRSSARRRSAAKRLRKLRDPAAGPALLRALEYETRDPRTWETQYQMIMALAESGYREAASFLRTLLERSLEPMVLTAIGDALVRLGRQNNHEDAGPILELLSRGPLPLAEGAIRGVAMLRLKPRSDTVRRIVRYASRPENEQVRFWVAAAAPGWDGPDVDVFLRSCLSAQLESTRKAAEAALQKKYLTWSPL